MSMIPEKRDELQEKFTPKKKKNMIVQKSYERIGLDSKAERLEKCGKFLEFLECPEDGFRKLVMAYFCKDRLCPMCNWRRSRKHAAELMQMLHVAQERVKMRFIFLTLTVKNVDGDKLKSTIDGLMEGFHRLFKYKDVDNVVVGWIRKLEVTYNEDSKTFHPHFHVLIGVKPGYFGEDYIKHAVWTSLWQKAMKLDYEPIVWVDDVKAKKKGQTVEAAVAETAKYSVKDEDYIRETDSETDKVLEVFVEALTGRQLIGFGKLFKTIRAELKLIKPEAEEDLVGADEGGGCECPLCNSTLVETIYTWNFAGFQYSKG